MAWQSDWVAFLILILDNSIEILVSRFGFNILFYALSFSILFSPQRTRVKRVFAENFVLINTAKTLNTLNYISY
jgi:hypothetical protein